MRRRLLDLLTALSLLTCVAACVLWVRSYAVESSVEFKVHDVRWAVASSRRTLRLDNEPQRKAEREQLRASVERDMGLLRQLNEKSADLLYERRRKALPDGDADGRDEVIRNEFQKVILRLADANNRAAAVPSTAYVRFSIPHGVAVAGLALPILAGLLSAIYSRRRRVRMLGLCRHCGYDFRATPDRCPECGTTP